MKITGIAFIILMLSFSACRQSNSDSQTNEQNSPGPITESDKQRYNLNTNDVPLYGTMDSVGQDSLRKDTVK